MKRSKIQYYMSSSPKTIGGTQSIASALSLMQEHKLEQLPVLQNGKLVGMIFRRDIEMLEAFENRDPETVLVQRLMNRDILHVEASELLAEVTQRMIEERYPCVVVTAGHEVVGTFGILDALRAIKTLYRETADVL